MVIVKACDECQVLNTDHDLFRVHEDYQYERYDHATGEVSGKKILTGLTVFNDRNTHELLQPVRDLCRSCLALISVKL